MTMQECARKKIYACKEPQDRLEMKSQIQRKEGTKKHGADADEKGRKKIQKSGVGKNRQKKNK
jgi:hypothetical protein